MCNINCLPSRQSSMCQVALISGQWGVTIHNRIFRKPSAFPDSSTGIFRLGLAVGVAGFYGSEMTSTFRVYPCISCRTQYCDSLPTLWKWLLCQQMDKYDDWIGMIGMIDTDWIMNCSCFEPSFGYTKARMAPIVVCHRVKIHVFPVEVRHVDLKCVHAHLQSIVTLALWVVRNESSSNSARPASNEIITGLPVREKRYQKLVTVNHFNNNMGVVDLENLKGRLGYNPDGMGLGLGSTCITPWWIICWEVKRSTRSLYESANVLMQSTMKEGLANVWKFWSWWKIPNSVLYWVIFYWIWTRVLSDNYKFQVSSTRLW